MPDPRLLRTALFLLGLVPVLAAGSALASCSLLLGGDKNFVDLDGTSSASSMTATGSGGASGEVATGSGSGGSPAGSGAGGEGATTGQGSSTGGCTPGQGGCGGAGSTSSSSSSASSSSTGGPPPCGAGTLGSLSDTFTGNTLDTVQWGPYAGNGGSVAQTSNQISVFVPGPTGSNAGIYAQDAWSISLLGCSASLKVLDSPKIGGITTFFLLSAKNDNAYAIAFTQSGIYLNLEVNVPGGGKPSGQITYVKGVHVYWRFRATSGSGGKVHWDTSADGITWQEHFSLPTADVGFSLDKARVNFGLTGSGGPGTTVHFDNFNVAP